MDSAQQTLRVAGLPLLTQESDVIQFFNGHVARKHGGQIIESVGPICDHASRNTKRTTVSFSSHNVTQQALNLPLSRRRFGAERGGAADITLDAGFRDLTTLHSTNNPATGKPDIDIVALHGLTGHAWNSFTTLEIFDKAAGRTKETNWLRDILPRLLEQDQRQKIYSRVMSYGYNADVWMTNSVADIDVPVNNLLTYLESERTSDSKRPLFFIAHSLGGVVVKQAIVELANTALRRTMENAPSGPGAYNFPVKGCMFFGVPNQGSETADTASGFLSVLSTVFNVNKHFVNDLKSKSQRLANIAMEFRTVRHEHYINVISFFETRRYKYALDLIVEKDSAVISYDGCPRSFGIDRNHKEMARFKNDDAHALEPAIQFLAQFAQRAINEQISRSRPRPTPPPMPPIVSKDGPTKEDEWSKLRTYDTVFLVDDSPSMRGYNWDLVKEILDYSTTVATHYDPDGIDVHFLNNIRSNMDNVRDSEVAGRIHHNIDLQGATPMLDQLSRHLDNYLFRFQENRHVLNYKGYNLIILTDGEPDHESEDPDDISDHEDARKHMPVYRMIRKKIVEIARELDKANAASSQVGIQFCQIGDADHVKEFFEYLDDHVKKKFKLKRDMVDTIQCLSFDDLNEQFYEKLLLGAIVKKWDHNPHPVTASNNSNVRPEPQPYQPHQASHHDHQQSYYNHHDSLSHRPHHTDRGNNRAYFPNDDNAGEGSSTAYTQSDPLVTTYNSLTAAQRSDHPSMDGRFEMPQRNYTTLTSREQTPARVPSPRIFSFPPSQAVPPTQGVARSSTEAIGAGPRRKLPWQR